MFGKFALKSVLAIVLLVNCSTAEMELKKVQYAPFEKIEAEDYSIIAGARTANDCGNTREYHVGRTSSSSVIGYAGVDFDTGAKGAVFNICGFRADNATGTIQLRLDSPTRRVVGTVKVEPTGGSCHYVTNTITLTKVVSGVHDLFLTFAFAPPPATELYFVDIDWFYFVKA